MNTFSIGEALRFAWETFKRRAWFFIALGPVIIIGAVVLAAIVAGVIAALMYGNASAWVVAPLIIVAIPLLVWVLTVFLMGYASIMLRADRDIESLALGDLWHPHPFWRFFTARLLVKLVTCVGFILLVVPGVYWMLKYMFATLDTLESSRGPIDAMKESARITKGALWDLALFTVVLGTINVIGYYALFIGLFVTVPVSMLATVHVYRALKSRAA